MGLFQCKICNILFEDVDSTSCFIVDMCPQCKIKGFKNEYWESMMNFIGYINDDIWVKYQDELKDP